MCKVGLLGNKIGMNQIFDEVRQKGDEAIAKYTSYFDGITLKSVKNWFTFHFNKKALRLKYVIQ